MTPKPSPALMPRRAGMTESRHPALVAELIEGLEAAGFKVDTPAMAEAAEAFRPVPLDSLMDPLHGPGLVGPAWRHVMNHKQYPLVALALTLGLLSGSPAQTARSLTLVGLRYDRTLALVRALYGIKLYEHARRLYYSRRREGVAALRTARRVLETAIGSEQLLSEGTRLRVHGMCGTAILMLVRAGATSPGHLGAAQRHLTTSSGLGNRGQEHLALSAEVAVRYYDHSGDAAALRELMIEAASVEGTRDDSAHLQAAAAESAVRLLQTANGDPADRQRLRVELSARVRAAFRLAAGVDEAGAVKLALLRGLAAAHRADADGDPRRSLVLRGVSLPFGLRPHLLALVRQSGSEVVPLLRAVVEDLDEPCERRLHAALDFRATVRQLESRALEKDSPDDAADALRASIRDSLLLVELGGESRMQHWQLGLNFRTLAKNLPDDDDASDAAVAHLVRASELDPSWPAPIILLAGLADDARFTLRREPQGELAGLVFHRKSHRLYGLAIERCLDTTELGEQVLGGRSDVFVFDDLHSVTPAALVFKPMAKDMAERERAAAQSLRAAVAAAGLASRFATIRSLAIVELGEHDSRRTGQVDSMHVMRREQGRSLADLALDAATSGVGVDVPLLDDVLRYLALFHSLDGCGGDADRVAGRRDVRNRLKMWLTEICGREQALALRELWERALPPGLDVVCKRDAHPGNWLVSPSGRLVALDLESRGFAPVLLEVAQLLEDGPCLPVDDAGWSLRQELVARYSDHLRTHGVAVGTPPTMAAYEAFAALRAVMRLSKPDKWQPVQVEHALRLLRRCSSEAESPALRAFSAAVLSHRSDPTRGPVDRVDETLSEDLRVTLSRTAAYVLRHAEAHADHGGSGEGWMPLPALVERIRATQPGADQTSVVAMLTHVGESRFEVANGAVRARYGHSVPVTYAKTTEDVPELLYHGTTWERLGEILGTGQGLLPMGRQAVHLSVDVDTARRVGQRHGTPVVLGVRAAGLADAGIGAHHAAEGVWLVSHVPVSLLFLTTDMEESR